MSILHPSKHLYTFPFLHKINEGKHHPDFPIKTKASEITVYAETELSESLLGPG